ncbi:MAG: lysozyme inhibitor LprI family protein [Erythrobacteraceae bacterium]|jgi:uncharacterized protein YecT (DUF1311 family)
MIAVLVLPLLLQSVPTLEAPPVPGWNCANPQVQAEMNWCAGQDYAAADADLNAQWKITAAAMKQRDVEWAELKSADTRPGYFKSLLEAQRGWLRYRDAHCQVDGYSARGGSLEPLLVATCKARLTRTRTEELKALVESPG